MKADPTETPLPAENARPEGITSRAVERTVRLLEQLRTRLEDPARPEFRLVVTQEQHDLYLSLGVPASELVVATPHVRGASIPDSCWLDELADVEASDLDELLPGRMGVIDDFQVVESPRTLRLPPKRSQPFWTKKWRGR